MRADLRSLAVMKRQQDFVEDASVRHVIGAQVRRRKAITLAELLKTRDEADVVGRARKARVPLIVSFRIDRDDELHQGLWYGPRQLASRYSMLVTKISR